MKRILLTTLLVMMVVGASVSTEAIVREIIGMSAECNLSFAGCTAIPTTVTALCTSSCVSRSSASFTSANRFWGTSGSGCRTSSNGGSVWAACASEPLSSGGQEQYAGAADGSVIAIGSVGTTCTIKRSTNNGTSWSTVYTNAGIGTSCAAPGSSGSALKCLSDGQCNFIFNNSATTLPAVLASTDSGQNWVLSGFGAAGSNPISLAWNGTAGIATANTLRSPKFTAGSWGQGAAGFAGCGTISGSVVYNGVGYGLCKDPTVGSSAVRLMTADGALFKTLTLPGAQTGAGVGILAYGWNTNIIYVVTAANTSPQALGMWVSQDNGVSFTQIYTSPTSVNSMSALSDMYAANGCIYFSAGTSSMFGKVC